MIAGKCNNLSCYVSAELLLAGASLDIYICTDLAVLEADELKWNNVCSLVKKLIERMLTICSWLTKDYRSCYIVDWLTISINTLTI